MEKTNNLNSCVMIAANLIAPVSLACLFKPEDLAEGGVVYDSHLTLNYAPNISLTNKDVIEFLSTSAVVKNTIPGGDFTEYIKNLSRKDPRDVLDLFYLGYFENDEDYLVLKLRKDTEEFKVFNAMRKAIGKNLDMPGSDYNPHITLANLKPGTVRKYFNDYTVNSVLKDTQFVFEDLILSIGKTGENDYNVWNLTCNNGGDRFFRIRSLTEEGENL